LEDLSHYGEIAAVFLDGASGNDHRWELRSSAGELLALTKRVHSGGRFAKTYWKLVSATGMDAGNDIHTELRGADDRVPWPTSPQPTTHPRWSLSPMTPDDRWPGALVRRL
jgi:hypothetical protein